MIYKLKYILISLFFVQILVLAQTQITGKIVDAYTLLPISEVLIQEKSTAIEFLTDSNGYFNIKLESEKGNLVLQKDGYFSRKINFSQSEDLGVIFLTAESILLNEVTVNTEINKTKASQLVAQSIPIQNFQNNVAHGELVYGFKQIPSVYLTQQGGGTGDAKISIRGFDPAQTAVLINNIPVNDMETGWIYWSNWNAIADMATGVEIQSGMGNKSIPLATFGGSIELKTTNENTQSYAEFSTVIGNNLFLKNTLIHHLYNPKKNSFFTAFLGRNATDGMIKGTNAVSNTYYFDVTKKTNRHTIQWFTFGAPQWHQQRSNYTYHMASLSDYLKYGQDYNYNFGSLNGKGFNWTENYFHKNLMQLKWKFQVDASQLWENSVYTSIGTGGGSYESGNTPEGIFPASNLWRNKSDGHVNFDAIAAYNAGNQVNLSDGNSYLRNDPTFTNQYINTPFNAGITKVAFSNKHYWIGAISEYSKTFNKHLTLKSNYHFRYTDAQNFDHLNHLLGANAYMTFFDQNNAGKTYNKTFPININTAWNLLKKTDQFDKLNFHYQSKIVLHSLTASANYGKNRWNLFTNINFSIQQNQRIDFFNYTVSDPDKKSNWFNQSGFSMLAGARYELEKNAWFVNVGLVEKPNRFENIFLNYKNDINKNLSKEKAFSSEMGYQYKNKKVSFDLNFYATYWKNKYTSLAYQNPDTQETGTAFLQGVNQLHIGFESFLDFSVNEKIKLNALVSLGNWSYAGNAEGNAFNFAQQKIGSLALLIDGVKVGDAAQFYSHIQLTYKPESGLNGFVNVQWIDGLYSKLNMDQNLNKALKLPGYELVDVGLSADLYESAKIKISADVNIQNLFNKSYISESHTNFEADTNTENWNGVAINNKVFFGLKRTWSFGLKCRF